MGHKLIYSGLERAHLFELLLHGPVGLLSFLSFEPFLEQIVAHLLISLLQAFNLFLKVLVLSAKLRDLLVTDRLLSVIDGFKQRSRIFDFRFNEWPDLLKQILHVLYLLFLFLDLLRVESLAILAQVL
jgi:hypothetical protein